MRSHSNSTVRTGAENHSLLGLSWDLVTRVISKVAMVIVKYNSN